MTAQESFGIYDHDSLQYHFFCGDVVGAARLFFTRTLQHASMWVFDGASYREFQSADQVYDSNAQSHLNVQAGGLSFSGSDDLIEITPQEKGGDGECRVRLTPRHELRWSDTISTVIHQPNMQVELRLDGKSLDGIGYCKRYGWTPAPSHWGYRFIQGFLEGGEISVWTAEATFGLEKYDYFKMLMPDGEIVTTPDDVSCHRQNGAQAISSIGPIQIELEPLSVWDHTLESDAMNSRMRQRACRLVVRSPLWEKRGFAINETCYGTLG